ncbi:STAS domain-containing protein [Saccharomonospora piscinae]|uniref:STAS domain-containing protein n=1 Tax=Saccharomonospora piscinae TaxID=687388 RepID=UPI000466759A|nr:STAS domain-containing protein [Saccharomonospora piscinae]
MTQANPVRTERRGDVTVAWLTGELDLLAVQQCESRLRELCSSAGTALVLDLEGLTFLASSGLSMLVGLSELCRTRGTALRVRATSRIVLRPIQLTGLEAQLGVRGEGSLEDVVREVAPAAAAGSGE